MKRGQGRKVTGGEIHVGCNYLGFVVRSDEAAVGEGQLMSNINTRLGYAVVTTRLWCMNWAGESSNLRREQYGRLVVDIPCKTEKTR
jgi:hypothetical protein